MMRPSCQKIMWPPAFGLKFPSAVMPHQPCGRFAKSLCLKQTVLGPKLMVAAAHTPLTKLRNRFGSCLSNLLRVSV